MLVSGEMAGHETERGVTYVEADDHSPLVPDHVANA